MVLMVDIRYTKFLGKDVLESRSSEFIAYSHYLVNAMIMGSWNSLWWSTSGIISHTTSLLPSRDCVLHSLT